MFHCKCRRQDRDAKTGNSHLEHGRQTVAAMNPGGALALAIEPIHDHLMVMRAARVRKYWELSQFGWANLPSPDDRGNARRTRPHVCGLTERATCYLWVADGSDKKCNI